MAVVRVNLVVASAESGKMKLILENWRKYLAEGVSYNTPNFEYEWSEAQRYPQLKELGQEGWIQLAQTGAPLQVKPEMLRQIGNTTAASTQVAVEEFDNLEPDKQQRFMDAFKSGNIELPIVVKIGGKLDLLGGNTRFTGLVANNVMPQVWLIDVDKNIS